MRDKKPVNKKRLRAVAAPQAMTLKAAPAPLPAPNHSAPSPAPAVTGAPSAPAAASSLFERALRHSKILVHVLTLIPLYVLASVCIGVSMVPGAFLFKSVSAATANQNDLIHYTAICIAAATGFFLYGFTLIFVLPVVNFVLRSRVVAWRGPYYSSGIVNWYIHNGLIYLARYTFLEFITPTPLNVLFYRMMGMRVGQETQINSVNISDASMITIGDRVTIGGSATLIGHYGMGGILIIAPLIIGNGATIGLKATIMGGVEIGERAKIMPNSVVLPRTKIPAGETWGGVPARKIELRKAA